MTAWLLAHQGGWDEVAIVVVPLIVMFGVLVVANRKAKELAEADAKTKSDAEIAAKTEPEE